MSKSGTVDDFVARIAKKGLEALATKAEQRARTAGYRAGQEDMRKRAWEVAQMTIEVEDDGQRLLACGLTSDTIVKAIAALPIKDAPEEPR